jgi:zinc transport system permease protein
VALGIFIATMGGSSFTKFNKYLIGDILSVTPAEIGLIAVVLVAVATLWCVFSNKLTLSTIHPQLASSRAIPVSAIQTGFTTVIAVVVTLSLSWVGLLILNSLLILPGAASRNIAGNLRQYCLFSVLFALVAGISGLIVSYLLGVSAGAAISLTLALIFAFCFIFRKGK